MSQPKEIAVLGSTGSVGEQTLAVAAQFPERFRVVALAAGRNIEKLSTQVMRFQPALVCVADARCAEALRARIPGSPTRVLTGEEGLLSVATHPADLVVAALVGAVGLEPTLAAIRSGRNIALANKEVMVMAGALVLREIRMHGVELLPVDSEHSAIFQALAGQRREDVARLLLTASGGPFRSWPAERIAHATVADALKHPNWNMGPKITVDSATLMNKGLEVIEARWLFDLPPERIEIVVHPQSIVHSMVEFVDGSVLAQLGIPDMRVPIAVALAHPERLPLGLARLDLPKVERLEFEAPDPTRFPALELPYAALRGGEAAPAVLNAANEVAVAAFLEGAIPFPEIVATNAAVLDAHLAQATSGAVHELADVRVADGWARATARARLGLTQVESA
ncbi:MAG TPA: 1-deoxy-D-xylulose-5-phosphate reductoisomerase [Myxococcota bacterium]|nr:1-deoxy-D-xylulose-5-phosphate reductoisomerase [Myxococcota bacterium]